jgi:hypothetical protein
MNRWMKGAYDRKENPINSDSRREGEEEGVSEYA